MNAQTRLCALLTLILSACGGGGGGATPPGPPPVQDAPPLSTKISPEASRLRASGSCQDLKAYVARALTRSYLDAPYCFDCVVTFAIDSPAATPPPPDVPAQVSQTNNQVAGVDEPDIIKADADGHLFVAHEHQFIVTRAFPPTELSELARIEVDGFINAIALDEAARRAVLITSNVFDPFIDANDGALGLTVAPNGVELVFVDVADPAAPRVIDKLWFRGYSLSGRMIDGRLHLVLANYIDTPRLLLDDQAFSNLISDYNVAKTNSDQAVIDILTPLIRDKVSAAVAATSVEALLPNAGRRADGDDYTPFTPVACADIYRPDVAVSVGLTLLVGVDSDGANLATGGAIASVSDLYTSRDNVYVLQSSSHWWWDRNQAEQTAIHQFAIGNDAPRFVASGVVDGLVRNRFSLDQHDGYLRVATTQRIWDPAQDQVTSTNHMFVLQARDDGVLAQTGAVRDFVFDESIFSARYIGDRGYVVTFRQIDPLFSFDLSDPFAPQLGGELEIPGFSTYMHPYDRDHLLTIGRGGDADGADLSLKLQLFDVSVLSDPRLLHSFSPSLGDIEPTRAWSEAAHDPRAFTFFAGESLLSVPLSMRDRGLERSFNGFLAVDVDRLAGFTERSRVDHNDLAAQVYCSDADPDPALCIDGSFHHFLSPRRTVVMSDGEGGVFLYTMSNIGLKATPVDDAQATLGSILF